MLKRFKRLRRRTKWLLTITAPGAAIALGWWLNLPKPPPYREVITRKPGEPPHVWKPMRARWILAPGVPGIHSHIRDLVERGDSLVYVCECEAGCVEKSSGKVLWKYPLASKQEIAQKTLSPTDFEWRLSLDDRFVFLAACREENT